MKTKGTVVLLFLTTLLLSSGVFNASAQDVYSIIEKLNKLEKQLARLESKQTSDLAKVQEQLSKASPDAAAQVPDSVLVSFSGRLDQLIKELSQLEAGGDSSQSSEELKALSSEVAQLRETVNALDEKIKATTKPVEESKPTPTAAKEEIKVTSKFRLTLYGFVKFESFYDNTEVAKGDWLLYVKPGDSPQIKQNVFSMNARHTRLGMKVEGPLAGEKGKINGQVEMDFAGSFPNSTTAARQPMPRLRSAWMELNFPKWEALFGQDWALISTPFPNTASFLVGAGLGNLWNVYPQIKWTFKFPKAKLALSLNRPMSGNEKYNDFDEGSFDIVGDGERTGMPWIMARQWFYAGPATFSLSGHFGKEKISDLSSNPHFLQSYSINADAVLTGNPVAITVRGFYGENLNSFFGGVFQGFTRTTNSVSNIASRGGWIQGIYTINPSWAVTLGAGTDDPSDSDLTTGMRSRNDWMYANVEFNIKKTVSLMLEDDYVKTSYLGGKAGENNRIQLVTYFRF
jgi:outer membrane murein-binding lipoprotein Lpp